MPYTVQQRDHITVIRWTGRFDLEGAKQVIHLAWANDQFHNPYLLLDLRDGANGMRPGDMQLAADFVKRFMRRRAYGRIAYVVQSRHVAMVEWFVLALREAPYELLAFTQEQPAMEWLEVMLG